MIPKINIGALPAFVMLLLCSLLSVTERAEAQSNPWSFQAPRSVAPGQKAELLVTPHVALRSLDVKIVDRKNAEVARRLVKKPRTNTPLKFKWSVPIGASDYTAHCTGLYDEGQQTSTFSFRIISAGALKVTVSKKDVNFAKGVVSVTANQGLDHAEVQGFDDKGGLLFDERVELKGQKGRVDIRFPGDSTQALKKLELKVYDLANQWTSYRFVNWYLEIEQDQVVFETGKWELRPAEAKKIDPVIQRIDTEIERYRRELGSTRAGLDGLKLYVAGCTDTVGSKSDNIRLSTQRARSIARYLRQKKVKARIFYQGFGESLLSVPTADNVAEAKNRRAIYILTPDEPRGLVGKGRKWQGL